MTARQNKMRRIDRGKAIYILPNLCTTLSLFSGFLGIMSAVDGYFVWAACAILISLVMDGLDGKVARVTGTTSRFGVEYDSLADLVAFGVGPAIMAYMWALKPYGRLGWLAAFIFVACGALRLARFNVQVEEKGTKNFVGLPIPAAASMVACSVLLADQLGISGPVQFWPILVMMFVLSFLMVSNIPYVAFKQLGMAHLRTFNGLVAFILFISLIAVAPQIMGFVLMASYVVLGPLTAIYMERRRKKQEMQKKLREHKAAAL
jgi:CDP-diacylglycerol--serine O-phosphatidyltransferase